MCINKLIWWKYPPIQTKIMCISFNQVHRIVTQLVETMLKSLLTMVIKPRSLNWKLTQVFGFSSCETLGFLTLCNVLIIFISSCVIHWINFHMFILLFNRCLPCCLLSLLLILSFSIAFIMISFKSNSLKFWQVF